MFISRSAFGAIDRNKFSTSFQAGLNMNCTEYRWRRKTFLVEIRFVAHQIAAETLSMKSFAEPMNMGTIALHQCFVEVTNDS
jgi:hypothetical protein